MNHIKLIRRVLGVIVILAFIWFCFAGWTNRSGISGSITRLQYFESPSMVAIHTDSQTGVFVIPIISGKNQEDFSKWLSPNNVDIKSLDIRASSSHDKWADRFGESDSIQFGVHGFALGNTKPTWPDGRVAIGIAQENFPYQSFQFMSEDDFSKLTFGKVVNDVEIDGRFSFSNYFHISLRDKPFIIP